MSEPQFTKGGWLYQDGWNAVYTPIGNAVCDLSGSTTNENMDYNGHLLKVAPKMYKALEDALSEMTALIQKHDSLQSKLLRSDSLDDVEKWDQESLNDIQ